ncbi:MAG: type IV secretory system conjugative DNA transfer family protein [Psittacicella sp.]
MKNYKKIIFIITSSIILLITGRYLTTFIFTKIYNGNLNINLTNLYIYSQYFIGYKKIEAIIWALRVLNLLIGFSPILIYLAVKLVKANSNKESLYGDAKFATDEELKKSGLFFDEAQKFPEVLVGKMPGKKSTFVKSTSKFKDQFIKFANQQFIGVAAPTRSGKGVGIVIPNLLNFRDSVVVLDIKLENFEKTAGYRAQQGQKVVLFAPDGFLQDGKITSHRWNPLTYIRRDEIYRVGDIKVIADILYPTNTGGDGDKWNAFAGDLFLGITLFMLDVESTNKDFKVNFSTVLSIAAAKEGLKEWAKNVVTQSSADYRNPLYEKGSSLQEFITFTNISQEARDALSSFASSPDATAGSIVTNFFSPLSVFQDKITSKATSADDFDLRDVRKQKMSIYVGIQPRNLGKFSQLVNLFFSQLISENTAQLPEQNPELRYQCLLVLDEFTSMGKVNIIEKSVAYTAGFNIRYLFIYQAKSQLANDNAYGKDGCETLLSNTAMRVVYPPKKVDEDAEEISKTLGNKTFKIKTKGLSRGQGTSKSINEQVNSRALMLPQEVVELGMENYVTREGKETQFKINSLIMSEGIKPFIAHKIVYFDEPIFMQRVKYSEKNQPKITSLGI